MEHIVKGLGLPSGDRVKTLPIPIFIISCYCALSGLNDVWALFGRGSHIVSGIRVGAVSPLYGVLCVIEPFLFFAAAYSVIRLRRLCIVLLAACFGSVLLRLALSRAALERDSFFTIADMHMRLSSVLMIAILGIALIFLGYTVVLWRKGTLA
jgi:hypothetical protein